MQGVNRALARIQDIQNRVSGGQAAGQFQAALNAQLAKTDPPNVGNLQAIPPAVTGRITIGELIGVSPVSTRHPIYVNGAMTQSELTDYLNSTGLNARNGRLRADELGQVSGGWQDRSGSLLPPAANSWEAMRSAAQAEGLDLRFVDSYRNWDVQNAARQRYLSGEKAESVLPAGSSKHGLGLAVDLTGGTLVGPGDPQWQWMQTNGPSYGWFPISNESWHWEYRGT